MDDDRVPHIGGEDGGIVLVVLADVLDQVVFDHQLPIGQLRIGGMVGVGQHPAGGNGAAGQVGEDIARDDDIGGSQALSGQIGVPVIADTERILTEMGEDIAIQHDMFGGGELHRGGRLVPGVAHGLEFRTAGLADLQHVRREGRRLACQEGTALLAGEAFRRRRPHPRGVGKLQAGEAEIGDRRIGRAGGADQHFQARQDYLCSRHIRAITRSVIELAGGRIDIPLVRLGQEGQAVLQQQVRPFGMERVGDAVIAPDIIRPGRLLHGDRIAGDLFYR